MAIHDGQHQWGSIEGAEERLRTWQEWKILHPTPGPHSLSIGIYDICDVSSFPTVNQQVQGISVARGS